MHLSLEGNEMKQLSLNRDLYNNNDTSLLSDKTLFVSNLLALLLICL